jgi:hypothetical protein
VVCSAPPFRRYGSGDVSMIKKSWRVLGLVVTYVFALQACGDGEEGRERPPTCGDMCRVYAAARCDEFDERKCVDTCSDLADWGRVCATEYRKIIRCAAHAPAQSVVCANGRPAVAGTDCAQEIYDHTQCVRLSGGEGGAAGYSGTSGRSSAVLCNDACAYSGDRVCDDGGPGAGYGDCAYGTDCTDCGTRVWTAPGEPLCSNDCEYRADGRCDDGGPSAQSGRCTYGTDCADCGARAEPGSEVGGGGGAGPGEVCTDQCSFAADGLCDDGGVGADYWVCDLGTDCTDCGPRTVGGATGLGGRGSGGSGMGVGGGGGSTQNQLCNEECSHSGDGVCNDGGPGARYSDCVYGTDCTDCGVRVWTGAGEPLCSNDCTYSADDGCDDGGPGAAFGLCEFGTDCMDCDARDSAMVGVAGSGGGAGVPAGWTCAAEYYGATDGCDCGCGVADPDCLGFGCTVAGCDASGCQFCHAADGTSEPCD